MGWRGESPDAGSDLKEVTPAFTNCSMLGTEVMVGGMRMKKTQPLTSRRHSLKIMT